jgi:membrane-bound serine protease (ClpP class)
LFGALASLVAPAEASASSQPATTSATTSATPTTTVPPPPAPGAPIPPIDVIEVKGRIDGIVADFIERSLAASQRAGSQLLIIQLDSPGAVISDDRYEELTTQVRNSTVPVAVWVGPSGADARGRAVRLVRAAATSGIANGAHVGPGRGECPECRPADDPLQAGRGARRLPAVDAARINAVDRVTPTLGDFIVVLDGSRFGGRTLRTAEVVERGGQPRREPLAQVRFAKLDLTGRVLHATTNPWIACLLLVTGLLLILFEFYSVGIGVAGLTGAVTIALASYGLAALGATPLGLALIALAMFGYGVDVQAGVPRAWTVIGTVSLAVGSWLLFPGDRRVPWLAILVVLIGTLVFVLRGMTTMVRGRFSTAVIRRDSMVGETGEAASAIDTEGTVRLRGALWRARAVRAERMEPGTAVRVVAIDGVVFEVEPPDAGRGEGRSQRG